MSEIEKKLSTKNRLSGRALKDAIGKSAKGLVYISETDADVRLFSGGKAQAVTEDALKKKVAEIGSRQIEEKSFGDFFDRLTKKHDWQTAAGERNRMGFNQLAMLMRENLTALTVFRVGRINIDIYAVGLDAEGNLVGIKTKAVET